MSDQKFSVFTLSCVNTALNQSTYRIHKCYIIIYHIQTYRRGRNYKVNWGGGGRCIFIYSCSARTSFFSNQIQIDQFEKTSVGKNMNMNIQTPYSRSSYGSAYRHRHTDIHQCTHTYNIHTYIHSTLKRAISTKIIEYLQD